MAVDIKRGPDGLWYVNSTPYSTQEEAMQRFKAIDPEGYRQTMARVESLSGEKWKIAAGWCLILAVVGLVIFAAMKLFTTDPAREASKKEAVTLGNMQYLAQGYVKGKMKDPSSAQFQNQRGVCGEVNSKNGFGAYTGFRRYIATSPEMVIIEHESGLSPADFNKFWNQSCS